MSLIWVPIHASGLSFTFVPEDIGTLPTMAGSTVTQTSDGFDQGRWSIEIHDPQSLQIALNVRITPLAYANVSPTGQAHLAWGNNDDDNAYGDQANESVTPLVQWLPNPTVMAFPFPLDPAVVDLVVGQPSDEVTYPAAQWLIEVQLEDTNYNCDCDDENNNQTLLQLRTRLLRRVGASAMTAVPGPGMAELADDFLQSSQEMLYREYDVLRTMRFFTWNLQQGVRFYDLQDNIDECQRKWDPRKVVWVGISGADEWWQPLRCGIQPEFYSWNDVQGWPQLYEVRQCIEIWPAPDNQAWKLRVKGDFGLEAFAADGDKTTIDSEAVFLHALARFKAHLQQPDARNYEADCMRYIGNLTAGAHQTRRYVPGAVVEPNAIPPVWLPLNGGPP